MNVFTSFYAEKVCDEYISLEIFIREYDVYDATKIAHLDDSSEKMERPSEYSASSIAEDIGGDKNDRGWS